LVIIGKPLKRLKTDDSPATQLKLSVNAVDKNSSRAYESEGEKGKVAKPGIQ
jgi:hypothetical protein